MVRCLLCSCIVKWLAYFAATYHSVLKIVISGGLVHNTSTENVPTNYVDEQMDGIAGHPLRSYLDYIGHLYQRIDLLPEQERFELSYRDFLQSPSQGISKGLVVENLTSTMVCNEKPSNIVMCIGKDRSNEDMFEKVLSIINNSLLPAVIFECTVDQKPSKAKYYLDDTFEVVSLLQNLSKQHDI
ncbi:hypothetical protein GIB67_028230 [Kingdonia uniflora]|uniref:Uncharacterized protein n=1 Tax=Kingdonia uniflora TaxID=39325 RepID=A0A7J7KZ81_9MAGN|nr:hypothetical protein GIB67_028230 [Kingdonia uniflora]